VFDGIPEEKRCLATMLLIILKAKMRMAIFNRASTKENEMTDTNEWTYMFSFVRGTRQADFLSATG
jgi:hypothetical protein